MRSAFAGSPGGDNKRPPQEFDRYLSQTDVWAIAFGCIVGWGAFVMPGTTFLPIAGPAGTVISMLISMAIMLVIGFNYAFLMIRKPGTGGVYSYTKEAFGREHAFLCAWFLCLSYLTIVFLNATALFVVLRTVFGSFFQNGFYYVIAGNSIYLGEVIISVIALLVIGLLFILHKPLLQRVHTVLAIILFSGTVIVTAFCVPKLPLGTIVSSFGNHAYSQATMILTIVLLSPWAFVGFDVICLETAHFRFPIEKSRKLISISILAGGFVYTAMSLISIVSIPDGFSSWQEYFAGLDQMKGVKSVPTFYAAQAVMGRAGLVIMVITALAAITTGIIAAYRATTRILSTMAEDRILSDRFSATSFSILFIMVISIGFSFLGRNALNWFVELTTFGAIIGFGYTSASAVRIARRENNRIIMVTGILGAFITAAFAVVQLVPGITALETMRPEAFLMLSAWCLVGFVFYWRTMSRSALAEYGGAFVSSTVLFALLLYTVIMWFIKELMSAEGDPAVQHIIVRNGVILLIITFSGMSVMFYLQNVLRSRHNELEREKIHAQESSRAKSQFLFSMSHDIRTPMNAIIGFTNLARGENVTAAEKDVYLEKIDRSGQQLLGIINDVLDMSRIESGKMELFPVHMNLRDALEEWRNIFSAQMEGKNIHFVVDASEVRDEWVLCDQNRFNRILLNLLSNAYKFTPDGGTVSVILSQKGLKNGIGNYELRVKDTGIGMSQEFVENIFTPFERERTSTVSGIQGTGLGLSIARGIITMMDGTIDVRTMPGEGTEFIIRLSFPIVERPEETSVEEEQDTIDFAKVRLLLVEDNEINMEIAGMVLNQFGFMVETAGNGKEALDMVAASEPGYYDAVLMDVQMPVMDGYEATRAIRALEDDRLAGIPIIAMTANAFKEDELAAKEAGMQAHIAKPLDVEKMILTITEVLGNKEMGGEV